jgi:hypothetical protein
LANGSAATTEPWRSILPTQRFLGVHSGMSFARLELRDGLFISGDTSPIETTKSNDAMQSRSQVLLRDGMSPNLSAFCGSNKVRILVDL